MHLFNGNGESVFPLISSDNNVPSFDSTYGISEKENFKNRKKIPDESIIVTGIKNCIGNIKRSKDRHDFIVLTPASPSDLKEIDHEFEPKQQATRLFQDAIQAFDSRKFESASQFYKKAANFGNLQALHNLGLMLLYGQGIPQNTTEAHQNFIVCSSRGLAASMSQLGYMHLYGFGATQDLRRARSWFIRSVEAGNDGYANYCLAVIYLRGYGVPANTDIGKKYLLQSVAVNFVPALYNLAVCYSTGKYDFAPNIELAVKLYKVLALRHDDPLAQNNLGVIYATGSEGGISRNPKRAAILFKLAAKKSISEASFNLGVAYSDGIGVSRITFKAIRHYYEASDKAKNCDAEYNLGYLFLTGGGGSEEIKSDLEQSLYWFQRAAQNGRIAARNNLMVLMKAMTRRSI